MKKKELSDSLLTDDELCNIIAIANSRDYSEIEFIGHVSICQDHKTKVMILERIEQWMRDNGGYLDSPNFVMLKKDILEANQCQE